MPARRAPQRVSTPRDQPAAPAPARRTAKKVQRRTPGKKARPPHPGEDERIAERRAKVWKLRLSGAHYRDIAREVGVDASTVCRDLAADRAAFITFRAEAAEDDREMALQRLDRLWVSVEVRLRDGHPSAVRDGVRVIDQRARLLGLHAPVKLAGPTGGPIEAVTFYVPDNLRRRRA